MRAGWRRAGNAVQSARRLEGLAWARAWRIANKPYFDAIYGAQE